MLKVGVIGAGGRMGSTTCRAINEADDLELVARVERAESLEHLVTSGAQVAVEFSLPTSVAANTRFCLQQGINTVVGATGLTDGDLQQLDETARENDVGVFVAPNFAIGAVLMMRFAAEAAPFFDRAEIVERHHAQKLDAPSGTALRTAAGMNERRAEAWSSGAEERESLSGARGGEQDGVRIHSLRLPGSVAHQEVILGSEGESLTIRHDSVDRASFMPGVLLAVRQVSSLNGLTVGLENLLDR